MKITLWDRFKFRTFMKLGSSMWTYTILHTDYWKRPYGVSFTSEKNWLKKVNEDMEGADDLDEEVEKED